MKKDPKYIQKIVEKAKAGKGVSSKEFDDYLDYVGKNYKFQCGGD